MKRNFIGRLIDASWTRVVRSTWGYRLKVIHFHRVIPTPRGRSWGHEFDVEAFRSLLDYLQAEGIQAVSLNTLFEHWQTIGASSPKRLIGIAFDDGTVDNYEYAMPLLLERGFSATIFVTTSGIDRRSPPIPYTESAAEFFGLSKPQICELHRCGIEIGSHGVHHYHLTRLADEELKEEVVRSKLQLEELLGTSVPTFGYPHGDADFRTARFLQEAGYQSGWNCCRRSLRQGDCPWLLPRFEFPNHMVSPADFPQVIYDGELVRRVRSTFLGNR